MLKGNKKFMSISDLIALSALIVSIVAVVFSVLNPFDRPKLIADAHFDEYLSAQEKQRRLIVTISNIGRRPLGVRHVALALSKDEPMFVPASENPLRFNGGQLGIIARGREDPLYLGEHESRNLPPLIIEDGFLNQIGPVGFLAIEDSTGRMYVFRVRNPYYQE